MRTVAVAALALALTLVNSSSVSHENTIGRLVANKPSDMALYASSRSAMLSYMDMDMDMDMDISIHTSAPGRTDAWRAHVPVEHHA